MHNACAQAQQALAIWAIANVVMFPLTIVGLYGWRRGRAPWRTIAYAVFVLCALLLFDQFALGVVGIFNPGPVTTGQTCPS